MKRVLPQIVGIFFLLTLLGCKEKSPHVAPSKPSGTDSSPRDSAKDASKHPISAPNREQIGASVRVRVFAGGLPVRNYSGALLHRDALKEVTGVSDRHRVVMTILKGWTDEQLHSAESKFLVFRNLPDSKGEPKAKAYHGQLARFDPQSGVALITYYQKFPSTSDVGFMVKPRGKAPQTGVALRFHSTPGAIEPAPRSIEPEEVDSAFRGPTFLPIPLLAGRFQLTAGRSKLVEFAGSESEPQPDDVAVVTNAPSMLDGFVSFDENGIEEFTPAPDVSGMISPGPQVAFKSVALSQESNERLKASFEFELRNGGKWPTDLFIQFAKLPTGTNFDVEGMKPPFRPIPGIEGDYSMQPEPDSQHRSWNWNNIMREGEEVVYLLQLAWKSDPAEETPSLFSRPAILRLTRKAAGMTATTEGILNLNERSTKASARPSNAQKLEALPIDAFPIAGGREVLVQLKGEPFWKRYSMEKNEWLPLPTLNHSNTYLAGDRSSLYALDRAAGEISKFALADLSLTAKAKLDSAGEDFVMIRAGCNTVAAPIHVLSRKGVVSLDPNSRLKKDLSTSRSSAGLLSESALATGDGMSLVSRNHCLSHEGDWIGLKQGYFDLHDMHHASAMVSAAFGLKDRAFTSVANVEGREESFPLLNKANNEFRFIEFPNVPLFAEYVPGKASAIPPDPGRLRFHPFFATGLVGEVESSEIAGYRDSIQPDWLPSHRICYDPYSGRVAILGRNDGTWTIHDVRQSEGQTAPRLLNWPDTCLTRSGEFRFDALLTAEAKITAELIGAKEPTPVTVDNRIVSFRVAEQELSSLLLLKITLSGLNGNVTYPIPIHVQGLRNPYIGTELNAAGKEQELIGSGFKSLALSKRNLKALSSSVLRMSNPVTEVVGPTGGHLGMITARSVELVSLATREVVNSIPASEKVKYYAGCGALFEFDANSRTLTRINVPDGRRGPAFSLSPNVDLQAIALGSERGQTLTLLLDSRRASINSGFPGAGPQKALTVTVLDGETLAAMGWDAPQGWAKDPNVSPVQSAAQAIGFGNEFPKQLVGSRNGALVVLPSHLLVLSPRYSIVAPFPAHGPYNPWGPYSGSYSSRPTGSITGLIAASNDGKVFRNGRVDDPHEHRTVSPCGRYEFKRDEGSWYEVRTLEGRRPLFRIYRLAALMADSDVRAGANKDDVHFIGDNGPLVVVSRNGQLVQFIDLDIGRVAREMDTNHFHVTSQPMPCVIEGAAFEYQIQVNNPAVVSSFKLRSPASGGSVSPSGVLRFSAPQNVRYPIQVDFSVGIQGRGGNTVLHDFPLLVLPKRVTNPPASPASGSRRL